MSCNRSSEVPEGKAPARLQASGERFDEAHEVLSHLQSTLAVEQELKRMHALRNAKAARKLQEILLRPGGPTRKAIREALELLHGKAE